MSNWVTITIDGIKDRKLAALVDALRSVALGEQQPDPTPNIIAAVTERIRTEVRACAKNSVDADEAKIPRSLLPEAVRMCIREMKGRLEMSLTDEELKAWDKDEENLRRVARCELAVTTPDDPSDGNIQQAQPTPITYRPRKEFSQRSQQGLLP